MAQLASSDFLRERLAHAALAEVRGRTWEAAFEQLAAGYQRGAGASEAGGLARAQAADRSLRAAR